jgi:hypothetical protein
VVYVPCSDGVRAVVIGSGGRMRVAWHAASAVTGSPVVGGHRVWALDPGGGWLYSLNPRTGRAKARVHVGAANRFATPAILGRLLLVPTLTGLTVVRS